MAKLQGYFLSLRDKPEDCLKGIRELLTEDDEIAKNEMKI